MEDANPDFELPPSTDAGNSAPNERKSKKHPPAAAPDGVLVFDPRDPLPTARSFLELLHTEKGERTLHHHGGVFYSWSGKHYPVVDEDGIRAIAYTFLEGALRRDRQGKLVPFAPTRAKVGDFLDALRAAANLPATTRPPAWLDYVTDLPPAEIIACTNGLLHVPERMLLPHTPLFFSLNAVDFAFDAAAPEPAEWLAFLEAIWPDDKAAVDCLQEIFGYALVPDTTMQKILLVVGPKRSGKGTIARVLTALVGADNVAAPTLAGLGTDFGLAPLIGKTLAIISDARLSGRADQQAIAERLLSISGEDSLTINRKHLSHWTGRLATRFLVLSNELPRLNDASGALASRFVVLTMKNSFYGKEDRSLTAKLLRELPGIFNWALAGLERLRDRGHFVPPPSSAEAVRDLEDLGSPIGAFLRQRCLVGPGLVAYPKDVFDAWVDWCEANGRQNPGTVQSFGRDLRSAVPGLDIEMPRGPDGKQYRRYSGLGLLTPEERT
jgi:putative DNA primase/helicase